MSIHHNPGEMRSFLSQHRPRDSAASEAEVQRCHGIYFYMPTTTTAEEVWFDLVATISLGLIELGPVFDIS